MSLPHRIDVHQRLVPPFRAKDQEGQWRRSVWMGFAPMVSRRCNQLHGLTGDRDRCVVTYRALD
jgi:hypothetical protein